MNQVSKSELKARMLEYFRKVEESGEELIVTDHRVPVLRVVPIKATVSVDDAFGSLRPKVRLDAEEVLSSTESEWEFP